MQIKTKQLKNGLKVLILSKKHLKTTSLSFVSQIGTIDEPDKQNGLAYLTHRMYSRGTRNYPDINKLNFEIEKLGGSFSSLNSKEKTLFNVTVPRENFKRSAELMAEILKQPLFRNNDLDKEKAVLLTKIKELGDSPRELAAIEFSKLLFKSTPYEQHPFGKEEDVKEVGIKDIKKFREKYFQSDSLMILAGDFQKNDLKNVMIYLNKLFDFKLKDHFQIKINLKKPGKKFSFSQKEVMQPILNVGSYAPSYNSADYYKYKILRIILGVGFGSVLHKKIRADRNLAYSIYYSYQTYKNAGFGKATSGILESKLIDATKIIFEVLVSYSSKEISKKELERAKGFYGGILTTYIESSSDIASFYGGQLLNLGEIKTYEEILEVIKEITLEDIYQVAQKYMKNNFYMNLVFRDKKYNSKLKKILKTYNANK